MLLPETARQLRDEDFWDGLPRPLKKKDIIKISVDLENKARWYASSYVMPASMTFQNWISMLGCN